MPDRQPCVELVRGRAKFPDCERRSAVGQLNQKGRELVGKMKFWTQKKVRDEETREKLVRPLSEAGPP